MPTHLLPRLNAPTYTSIFSSSSHVWMWELNYKESWGPKNWCFCAMALEKTLESHLDCKEIQPVHPRGNQSWIFIGKTDAEAETPDTLAAWCEKLTHLIRPWCWERLKSGGEEDNRGWDGWMASPTPWTWVWASSRSWWWTGKPGIHRVTKSRTWLSYWTELIHLNLKKCYACIKNHFLGPGTPEFFKLCNITIANERYS